MSYNNNFQLNTDDHPRERHDYENNDQFETENISKYLGHNLKSSDILRRSSPLDVFQPIKSGEPTNSNANFNNQRAHYLGHENYNQRKKE